MSFPTPYTVTHIPRTGLTEDADGNTAESFGTGVAVAVYGWQPHTVETRSETTMLETWDVDVLMPKTAVDVEDRMVVDGVIYEVVDVEDWTNGFHGWRPGIVVGLRKWEG